MVGLKVKNNFYPIGSPSFFTSFFNTIRFHLCRDKHVERYPYIMKELYRGKLRIKDVSSARIEILEIKEKLKSFPPSKVVWDINDLQKKPPWGDKISHDITDLSNYFVTNDGKDLFYVLLNALDKASELGWDVLIRNMFLRPDSQPKADQDI